MPAVTFPSVPRWTPAPPTSESRTSSLLSFAAIGIGRQSDHLAHCPVEWANLEIIDLAKAKSSPEARAEQVIKARDAMHKQGFFYVVNYGLAMPQVERIFDVAAVPFEGVSPEEKKAFEADIKGTGEFMGYKPLQYWVSFISLQLCEFNVNGWYGGCRLGVEFLAYCEWGEGPDGALQR